MNARSLIAPSFSRGAFVNASFTDAARVDPGCPEGARLIPLTKGHFAIVDEADYALVAATKWYAYVKTRDRVYAACPQYLGGARRAGKRRHIAMHRLIINAPPDKSVDHINGDGLDNRRENLRLCTASENAANCNKRSHNKTGFKGVSVRKGRYRAIVRQHGRNYYFGTYDTAEQAARAYNTAAKRMFGPFARLNEIDGQVVSHAEHNGERDQLCPATPSPAGLPRW